MLGSAKLVNTEGEGLLVVGFFQIHKDGKNVLGDGTFEYAEQARRALAEAPAGAYIVEIDIEGKILTPLLAEDEPAPEPSESHRPKRSSLSREAKITLAVMIVLGVAAILAGFMVPEVRRKLGLD